MLGKTTYHKNITQQPSYTTEIARDADDETAI